MKNYTLIGMSNTGKSFWRQRLEARKFTSFCCDDRIETRLEKYLKKLGYRGIQDVAKWMGQPYEKRFKINQALYLEQEIEVMREVLTVLRESDNSVVVDTTGSVIYTGDEIMTELREFSTIVFLDAPESLQTELYQAYIAEPKPVVWGNVFKPLPGESSRDALARCYPLLLKRRNEIYKRYADITLDYKELRSPTFTTDDFLRKIRAAA